MINNIENLQSILHQSFVSGYLLTGIEVSKVLGYMYF